MREMKCVYVVYSYGGENFHEPREFPNMTAGCREFIDENRLATFRNRG